MDYWGAATGYGYNDPMASTLDTPTVLNDLNNAATGVSYDGRPDVSYGAPERASIAGMDRGLFIFLMVLAGIVGLPIVGLIIWMCIRALWEFLFVALSIVLLPVGFLLFVLGWLVSNAYRVVQGGTRALKQKLSRQNGRPRSGPSNVGAEDTPDEADGPPPPPYAVELEGGLYRQREDNLSGLNEVLTLPAAAVLAPRTPPPSYREPSFRYEWK